MTEWIQCKYSHKAFVSTDHFLSVFRPCSPGNFYYIFPWVVHRPTPISGSSIYLLPSLLSSLAPKSLMPTVFHQKLHIIHWADPLTTWVWQPSSSVSMQQSPLGPILSFYCGCGCEKKIIIMSLKTVSLPRDVLLPAKWGFPHLISLMLSMASDT